jgi:hypothetical protein
MRRRRSQRSCLVEALFTAALVGGIYIFLTNGGPAWAGQWLADQWPRLSAAALYPRERRRVPLEGAAVPATVRLAAIGVGVGPAWSRGQPTAGSICR